MDAPDLLARSAANCAGAARQWGVRVGHRTAVGSGISAVDMGLGRMSMMSSACLLAAVDTPDAMDAATTWAEEFFAATAGGPFQIWSAWPTPDLSARGYRTFQVPGMVRPPGESNSRAPAELIISPARTPAQFRDASLLVDAVFNAAAPDPTGLFTGAILGQDLEVFTGTVDGRVVATSMAFVSDGLCGVYAVATAEDARGRGYGEALTWAATLFRPDLPAALQASPLGLPIYQRMGYEQIGTFTVWYGLRPASQTAL